MGGSEIWTLRDAAAEVAPGGRRSRVELAAHSLAASSPERLRVAVPQARMRGALPSGEAPPTKARLGVMRVGAVRLGAVRGRLETKPPRGSGRAPCPAMPRAQGRARWAPPTDETNKPWVKDRPEPGPSRGAAGEADARAWRQDARLVAESGSLF
jgi:hypothetical protein